MFEDADFRAHLDEAYSEICVLTWACWASVEYTETRVLGNLNTIYSAAIADDPFAEANDQTDSIVIALTGHPEIQESAWSDFRPMRRAWDREHLNLLDADFDSLYYHLDGLIIENNSIAAGNSPDLRLGLAHIGPRRDSSYEDSTYPKFHSNLQDIAEEALVTLAAAKAAEAAQWGGSDRLMRKAVGAAYMQTGQFQDLGGLVGEVRSLAINIHGNKALKPYV